jgi:toxin ParE1/3/4
MHYTLVFTPEAEEQLVALYRHIATASSPAIAQRYTEAILGCCEGLRVFPLRGVAREDIRPGLRLTHHKGRCVIAFSVQADVVAVIGIFYGGQDHETSLKDEPT